MSKKGINEWVRDIHENAVNHGFWDDERCFAETVALCHCELSEAVEEDRAGRPMVWHKCKKSNSPCTKCLSYEGDGVCTESMIDDKPEGIAVEMADCIIRIFDWAGHAGIDLERVIAEKYEYNKGRPYKHGKKY